MGNTSHGFLTALFGLLLPPLLIANLLAYGNMFNFEQLQANGDVYVGFTSFLNLLQRFDSPFGSTMADLFSFNRFEDVILSFVNHLGFGLPRLTQAILNIMGGNWDINFNLATMPTFQNITNIVNNLNLSNILTLLGQVFTELIPSFFIYIINFFSWLAKSLGSYWSFIDSFYSFVLMPVFLLGDVLVILAFSGYYTACIIYLVVSLFDGSVFRAMPHNNTSSWSSMADDWMDVWTRIQQNYLLPPLARVL